MHVFLSSVEVLDVSCVLEVWRCHGLLVIVLGVVIAHLVMSATVATILINLANTSMVMHHIWVKMMVGASWYSTHRPMTSTLSIDECNP